MRLDIAIPAYNEEKIIAQSLDKVLSFCAQGFKEHDWAVSLLINGSSDNTEKIARALAQKNPRLKVEVFLKGGRGRTLKQHWLNSEAEVAAYMDSDLAVDLEALPRLLEPLIKKIKDISVGSRFHPKAKVKRSFWREFISRGYSRLVRLVLAQPYKDLQCGFKAVRPQIFRTMAHKINDKGWFFDTELVAWGHYLGLRIAEVPVDWQETRLGKRHTKVNFLKIAREFILPLIRLRRDILINK
jgi:glycosyltransferase involved in cell wall biosynthesis